MNRYIRARVRWLILGTNVGSGTVAINLIGLLRTMVGVPAETFLWGVSPVQNLTGRTISFFFDQGTNIVFEPIRSRVKRKMPRLKTNWQGFVFDTVFLTSMKVGSYGFSIWLAGLNQKQITCIIGLNIVMFLATGGINCRLIDKLKENNPKN